MRYLRMLSNSAFAGLLAAAYFTLLLLLLNPEVPLGAAGPVLTVIVLSYGIHITVVSYALYVVRQIVIVEPSPPGWISLRLLTWSAAALSGTASVITWLHESGLRNALDPRALPSLAQAAAIFAQPRSHFSSLASRKQLRATDDVRWWRSCSRLPPSSRSSGHSGTRSWPEPVDVGACSRNGDGAPDRASARRSLCLDGASLDVISPAVAAGRLPNFGRMLDAGASMHLATTRPTQPEPVWASIMTGMWPSRHGVRGSSRYRPFSGDPELEVLPDYVFSQALVRFGLLVEEPYSSASLATQPLWRIAAGYGVRTGLIGLPLTHPATTATGFIVSDRFHRRADRIVTLDSEPAVSPSRLDDVARGVLAQEQPHVSYAFDSTFCHGLVRVDQPSRPIAYTIVWHSSSPRSNTCSCSPSDTRGSTPSVTTTYATRGPKHLAM